MRIPEHTYSDPLDLIWLVTARRLGINVDRSRDVFAAWDGKGLLTLGAAETLDTDDSLGQMILHEICHALIEGPDSFSKPDWGLQLTEPNQRVREHACLRLQAALTAPHGLREFFAATTSFRSYYDTIPSDPLESADDPAVSAAIIGMERATVGPWAQPIQTALQKTAIIANCVADIAESQSLWSTAGQQVRN